MIKLNIGHLKLALIKGRNWTIFVDWRFAEPYNRWRFTAGPKLWFPLNDPEPRRWRALGLDMAWYTKGLE